MVMNNELYPLIERISSLLRSESRKLGNDLGLQPVQLEALFYLSICNKYSDSPIAVSEYLGLTKGTVSQSLKVLESKNLIVKKKDVNDKRVTHLLVTEKGKSFLKETSPPKHFAQSISSLGEKASVKINDLLKELLASYQRETGRRLFGQCIACRHNQESNGEKICNLTGEVLSTDDQQLICREFDAATLKK